MQNAAEIQYVIIGKTKATLILYIAKVESLWLENKQNICQSGNKLHCSSFLIPKSLRNVPNSLCTLLRCPLSYQTKLGSVCFHSPLSRPTLHSLAKHACAYRPHLSRSWEAQSLISTPVSVVISGRGWINLCTKHDKSPLPIPVSMHKRRWKAVINIPHPVFQVRYMTLKLGASWAGDELTA